MINVRHFLLFMLGLSAIGCTSTPPVQPAVSSKSPFDAAVFRGESTQLAKSTPGEESFRAYYQGGSGFVSLANVRETVEDMASKQCARQDKNVRLIQERTSAPPHILGNFPRVEWVFECAVRTSSVFAPMATDKLGQLERLKKLFDSGALTQQEFEREKAKVLNAP